MRLKVNYEKGGPVRFNNFDGYWNGWNFGGTAQTTMPSGSGRPPNL